MKFRFYSLKHNYYKGGMKFFFTTFQKRAIVLFLVLALLTLSVLYLSVTLFISLYQSSLSIFDNYLLATLTLILPIATGSSIYCFALIYRNTKLRNYSLFVTKEYLLVNGTKVSSPEGAEIITRGKNELHNPLRTRLQFIPSPELTAFHEIQKYLNYYEQTAVSAALRNYLDIVVSDDLYSGKKR